MTKPNILIAVPAYGDVIKPGCTASLMDLVEYFVRSNIRFGRAIPDINGIDTARNVLGSMTMHETAFTHLLFIDSDMNFSPQIIARLIDADKPVIGCLHLRRAMQTDLSPLYAKKPDFNVPNDGPYFDFSKPDIPQSVPGVGTGIMLIKREVFEKLAATKKMREQTRHAVKNLPRGKPIYGFFDRIPVKGDLEPEDLSFCLRWRLLCHGEVWAIFDKRIGHRGAYTFEANISPATTLV